MEYTFSTQVQLSPQNVKLLKNDLMKMLWSITIQGIDYDSPLELEEIKYIKKRFKISILSLLEQLDLIENPDIIRTNISGYTNSVFSEYFNLIEEIDELGTLIENDKEYLKWLNNK